MKNLIGKNQILFNRVKIITHSGSFHADDVFAVATVKLWLEKNGPKNIFGKTNIEIVRTRDPKVVATGDIVVDIGGEYNPEKKIFDHHQAGGAGEHANGIPYSSFGLVWKEYGQEICGSQAVADALDKKIALPIDADDNGVDLCQSIYPEIRPYYLSDLVDTYGFVPKEKTEKILEHNFLRAVTFAEGVLRREIEIAKVSREEKKYVEQIYRKSDEKRIVILDEDVSDLSWAEVLIQYHEPLYLIKPDKSNQNWKVKAVKKEISSFENRKDLPEEWAGKTGEELEKITGVKGVIFCHNKRFIAVADTKAGAMELAKLAVEGN